MKTNVSLNVSDKDYLVSLNVSVMLRTELRGKCGTKDGGKRQNIREKMENEKPAEGSLLLGTFLWRSGQV